MGKCLGAAAVAATMAAAGLGMGSAWADDMPGGRGVSPQMDMKGGGATCSPSGTALSLTAQDHKFDKDCLAVPAGQAFTIAFDNKDNDRHNVAILASHMATQTLFQGDIVAGPKTITYSVPALKPGTWHFHCEVHPNLMNGTFVVAAASGAAPAPMPMPGPPAAAPAKPAPAPTPPPMSTDKPGATPPAAGTAPAPAPKTPAAATPVPVPQPAPSGDMSDMPTPGRQAAAGAASNAPAAPKAAPAAKAAGARANLPHTGPRSARLLVTAAGLAFAAGGLSVGAGARRNGGAG